MKALIIASSQNPNSLERAQMAISDIYVMLDYTSGSLHGPRDSAKLGYYSLG